MSVTHDIRVNNDGASSPELGRGGGGGDRVILVVEDDADMSEVMELILENLGYTILVARSVQEAVAVAGGATIGLVISDLGLPGESGLRLLAALGCKGKVPAIALSGYSSDADMRASREAGFGEHLVKPVTPERLLAVVRRMLHQ